MCSEVGDWRASDVILSLNLTLSLSVVFSVLPQLLFSPDRTLQPISMVIYSYPHCKILKS